MGRNDVSLFNPLSLSAGISNLESLTLVGDDICVPVSLKDVTSTGGSSFCEFSPSLKLKTDVDFEVVDSMIDPNRLR